MNHHTRTSYLFAVALLLVTTFPLSAQEPKLRDTLTLKSWGDMSAFRLSVAISGDGKTLASAGRWQIGLWDVATDKQETISQQPPAEPVA